MYVDLNWRQINYLISGVKLFPSGVGLLDFEPPISVYIWDYCINQNHDLNQESADELGRGIKNETIPLSYKNLPKVCNH